MKRLFLTFWLVIAFFFTSTIQASFYDSASFKFPATSTEQAFYCWIKGSDYTSLEGYMPVSACNALLSGVASDRNLLGTYGDCFFKRAVFWCPNSVGNSQIGESKEYTIRTKTCPPEDSPLYTYSYNDRCYYPLELSNLSNCASDYNSGTLLAADSSSPANVCKTDSDGSSCAYELTTYSDNLPVYSVNLEADCFDMDEGDEYSEYVDPDIANPQPEQCEVYGSGFACAEDPSNVCDDAGICYDGCGYVNDQFICFRDDDCVGDSCDIPDIGCTGDDCDTDPVEPCTGDDCDTDPTDPVEPCTGDDCDTSSGGGSASFELDYDRLGDLMNDAAETLIDENEISDGSDITDQISESSDLIDGEFNEFMENSLFDDIVAIPNQNIFGDMANMLPNGGACTNLVFKDAVIDICGVSNRLRPLLYFIFAFLTLIYLRDLLSTTIRSTGAQ